MELARRRDYSTTITEELTFFVSRAPICPLAGLSRAFLGRKRPESALAFNLLPCATDHGVAKMLLTYLLFGVFIAGLSVYVVFVFDAARWRAAGARKADENVPRDRFTWAEGVKSAAPNPKPLRASASLQGHDLERATTVLSLDLELHDETEVKGDEKEFQWGEYTLRELEERLTRDTQTLNLEGWKSEV